MYRCNSPYPLRATSGPHYPYPVRRKVDPDSPYPLRATSGPHSPAQSDGTWLLTPHTQSYGIDYTQRKYDIPDYPYPVPREATPDPPNLSEGAWLLRG